MHKKFTQISLIALMVISSVATTCAQFQKTIDLNGGDDYANVIIPAQTGSGSYLVGSTSAAGAGGLDAFITKIDSAGNPLWEKQYGGANTEYGTFIMNTSDGNLLVVGRSNSYSASQDMFVVKTDPSGTVLWSKTFGTDSNDFGVRATEGYNGYLIVGQTKGAPNAQNGRLDVLLVFVDVNGNVQWTRTFGTIYANEVPYEAFADGEGNFLIAGYTGVNIIGLNDAAIFVLDSIGHYKAAFLSGGHGDDDYRAIVGSAGSAYFIGNTNAFGGSGGQDFMVAKYDVSGNGLPVFQWLKKYGGAQNESLSSAQMLPDGKIIMIGHTNSFGTGGDALVVLIDSTGTLLLSKTFGGSGDDYLSGATFGNNGAMFAGYTNSFGGAQDNIYLVGPDQTGTTPCNNAVAAVTMTAMPDTSVGPPLADFSADTIVLAIADHTLTVGTNTGTLTVQCDASIGINEVASRLEFGLYPNPTSNTTELVLYSDKSTAASISVCDYLGQTVKTINQELSSGKNSITLDVHGFATGMYFVKVTTSSAGGVMPLSVH